MSYPKIKFYCNSKSNGNNIECICPSPHCQTKQEDALYHFYREAKNSYAWYGNHQNLGRIKTQRPHRWCKEIYGYCELSSASLQQVGLSFGLSSHKLFATILKNVDNKDYQLGMCNVCLHIEIVNVDKNSNNAVFCDFFGFFYVCFVCRGFFG